jgi:hypothetical protein
MSFVSSPIIDVWRAAWCRGTSAAGGGEPQSLVVCYRPPIV